MEYTLWITVEKLPVGLGVILVREVETMQTNLRFHTAHFKRFFYEGLILLFYILGLVMTVAVGAHGLEILSSVF